MRKFLLLSACSLFMALPACAFVAPDDEVYPFMDICSDDIQDYCQDAGDLGACMLYNRAQLNDDCEDEVFFWASNRYGWADPDMRDRWHNASHEEHRAYADNHWSEMVGMREQERTGGKAGPSGIMNRPVNTGFRSGGGMGRFK